MIIFGKEGPFNTNNYLSTISLVTIKDTTTKTINELWRNPYDNSVVIRNDDDKKSGI